MWKIADIIPMIGIVTSAVLLGIDTMKTGNVNPILFITFMVFSLGSSVIFGILKNWFKKKSNN